eukprot:scaffold40377_cov168-Amphora_coffeaeformis.AAC.4
MDSSSMLRAPLMSFFPPTLVARRLRKKLGLPRGDAPVGVSGTVGKFGGSSLFTTAAAAAAACCCSAEAMESISSNCDSASTVLASGAAQVTLQQ